MLKIKNIFKFLFFLFFGIGLFWIVYRKQDPQKMWSVFENVNFFWLVITIIVMLISHISRSFRWMMLIAPLGKKVSFWNATCAVFLGYFANLILPRFGEVTRCAVLGKNEKVPVSKLFGTVVVERVIDILMFLLCLILAIICQFDVFADLYESYFAKKGEVQTTGFGTYIMIGLLLLGVFIYYRFRHNIQERRIFIAIKNVLNNIKEGLRTVRKLKNLNLFIFHTILIWICYYLMMYFAFKVFDFSNELSAVVALSIFVLGSLGMILPAPGGVGSFHFFVISGLVLYMPEVPDIHEKAAAFALLVHGVQTLFIMIFGILSFILLPIINVKKKSYESLCNSSSE